MQKSINIPDELCEKIDVIAERERRNFTQQVVFIIDNFIQRAESDAIKEESK